MRNVYTVKPTPGVVVRTKCNHEYMKLSTITSTIVNLN